MAEGALQPLRGVRVLAVEQMISAPWCTQMLGRLGAEVIKVEHPTTGESGRASTPTVAGPDGRPVGATFIRNNLNKRSVGIDLKRGADLVLDLAAHCDVFVQNFKAGALTAMGLGYEAVRARRPDVVYVSISGFGDTQGPYRDWPAYASIAEAMSGIYDWAREPGRRPRINPVGGLGDIGTGMFAVIGILAALRQRDQTGGGAHLDLSMLDAMVAIADVVPAFGSLGETQRVPGAILTTFAASDGDVVVQVSREHQFERLAQLVGRPEWLQDDRFATRAGWAAHTEDVVRPAVETWSAAMTMVEMASALADAGIPAGPCFDAEGVLGDPHLAARDMLRRFDRGDGGTYAVPGNPIQVTGAAAPEDRRPPALGEDTDEVLAGLLGLGEDRISALRGEGVVG